MQQEISTNPGLDIPEDILCPITSQIMTEPVMLIDSGNTYEREGILQWLEKNNTDPLTNEILNNKSIKPNLMAKRLIVSFLDKHKLTYPNLIHETYFPDSLKAILVSALQKNDISLFAQTLSTDCRLLSDELKDKKNLFTIACESASLEILNIVFNKLQDKVKNIFGLEQGNGIALFFMVSRRLGLDGAQLIAKYSDWKDVDFQNLLDNAVGKNDIEIAKITLQLGAKTTPAILDKSYIAYQSYDKSDFAILKLLIRSGALINDLLLKSIQNQHSALIEFLLLEAAGQTNPNIIDSNGRNALMLAVDMSQIETIILLLKHRDINIGHTDQKGNTALHLATKKEEIEVIKLLLRAGFDPYLRNQEGFTAMDVGKTSQRPFLQGFQFFQPTKQVDKPSGSLHTLSGHTDIVYCLEMLDDDMFASGSWDKTIKIWREGQCVITLKDHSHNVICLQQMKNDLLVSGSSDKTIKLWDLKSERCLNTFSGHSGTIRCLQRLNAAYLASGSSDKTIKLWDIELKRCTNTLSGHTDSVNTLTLCVNGQLASGSWDNCIKIWDVQTGTCVQTLKGHEGVVRCLLPLPNGQLISGSRDKTIKIWDVSQGICLATLTGHTDSVNCLCLLDDQYLCSGAWDKTIRVWDLINKTLVNSFEEHTGAINSLVLQEDGVLLSSSDDKSIKAWHSDTLMPSNKTHFISNHS